MNNDVIVRAIAEALAVLQAGDREEARGRFQAIWSAITPDLDPIHECTLAHFMADTQDDPATELKWDLRALAAAERARQDGAQAGDSALSAVASFFPSLHLNVADAYLRLGDKVRARSHLQAGLGCVGELPTDGYGALIRGGLDRLAAKLGDSVPG